VLSNENKGDERAGKFPIDFYPQVKSLKGEKDGF
jgi:hypothetical protein